MKPIGTARVVLVSPTGEARALAAQLHRMGVARVTIVASCEEAGQLCAASRADVCIVLSPEPVPDVTPSAERDAPGLVAGVPSLLLVPMVTSYHRKVARGRGYFAVIPASVSPRLLYRHVRAALQRQNRKLHGRPRLLARIGLPFLQPLRATGIEKPTLH